jgi:hypothetical protein
VKFWIPVVAGFLVLMWFVLALGYSECNRGGCGDGYPVALATFYVLGAALILMIVASLARRIGKRRRQRATSSVGAALGRRERP